MGTPDLCDLLDAVRDVVDWHSLGVELKLSAADLGVIEVQHSIHGVARQKSAMFDRWLAQDVDASWNKLATALERMGKKTAAKAVREKYCGGAGAAATSSSVAPSTVSGAAVQRPTKIPLNIMNLSCLKYKSTSGKDERLFVMDDMAPRWRNVGLMLNFSSADLNNIETGQQKDPVKSCEKLMSQWLDGFVNNSDSRPKTWSTLIEVLKDARLGDLADKIEAIVK